MATVKQVIDGTDNVSTDPDLHWVSPAEGKALFDDLARDLMGMSGDEFIRRWEAGEYADAADRPGNLHIMRLAGLISFARQEE